VIHNEDHGQVIHNEDHGRVCTIGTMGGCAP